MSLSLRRWIATRRTLRALDRVADALDLQNGLLARLVDHLCPESDVPGEANGTSDESSTILARRDPGDITSLDPFELAAVDAFQAKILAEQHRDATDDEIMDFLAERKSAGWQQELNARAGRRR